jgi:hypothetical protein
MMSRYDRPNRRVYMTFFLRKGWQVRRPQDAPAQDPDFQRPGEGRRAGTSWEALGTSEAKQLLEYAIEVGCTFA